MPDLGLSVVVSRDLLGLAGLEINDHLAYYVGPQLLGGQVAWNRQQVTSPFIDGQVTTWRTRQNVTEQLGVEVLGDTPGELNANLAVLLAAFIQDSFHLAVAIGAQSFEYACEAADYQVGWTGPRWVACQLQVVFAMPRQPVPVAGAF